MVEILTANCKIAVVVSPYEEGSIQKYGHDAILGLKRILKNHNLNNCDIFFDKGIFRTRNEINKTKKITHTTSILRENHFHFEQDSKKIYGIQLADLAAHYCSIMLKDQIRPGKLILIKSEEDSGYPIGTELRLAFELWAKIRYSFFTGAPLNNLGLLKNSDLYISRRCSDELRSHTKNAFSKIYLGCTR